MGTVTFQRAGELEVSEMLTCRSTLGAILSPAPPRLAPTAPCGKLYQGSYFTPLTLRLSPDYC